VASLSRRVRHLRGALMSFCIAELLHRGDGAPASIRGSRVALRALRPVQDLRPRSEFGQLRALQVRVRGLPRWAEHAFVLASGSGRIVASRDRRGDAVFSPRQRLDVAVLDSEILEPLLGIRPADAAAGRLLYSRDAEEAVELSASLCRRVGLAVAHWNRRGRGSAGTRPQRPLAAHSRRRGHSSRTQSKTLQLRAYRPGDRRSRQHRRRHGHLRRQRPAPHRGRF